MWPPPQQQSRDRSHLKLFPACLKLNRGADSVKWHMKGLKFVSEMALKAAWRSFIIPCDHAVSTSSIFKRSHTALLSNPPTLTFPVPSVWLTTFLCECVYAHFWALVRVCTVLFSAELLCSRDKLTFELSARGHMFLMGVSGSMLNSLSQTWGI